MYLSAAGNSLPVGEVSFRAGEVYKLRQPMYLSAEGKSSTVGAVSFRAGAVYKFRQAMYLSAEGKSSTANFGGKMVEKDGQLVSGASAKDSSDILFLLIPIPYRGDLKTAKKDTSGWPDPAEMRPKN